MTHRHLLRPTWEMLVLLLLVIAHFGASSASPMRSDFACYLFASSGPRFASGWKG